MSSPRELVYHNTTGGGHEVCRWAGRMVPAAILSVFLVVSPMVGHADRIFFRAQVWLTTSPETQLRLVTGTLRAWEELAEAAEARGPAAERLSVAEREALRLLECLRERPGLTLEDVRQTIQVYAGQHPEGVFSTFGDMAVLALDRRCPGRDAR